MPAPLATPAADRANASHSADWDDAIAWLVNHAPATAAQLRAEFPALTAAEAEILAKTEPVSGLGLLDELVPAVPSVVGSVISGVAGLIVGPLTELLLTVVLGAGAVALIVLGLINAFIGSSRAQKVASIAAGGKGL